MRLNQDVVPSTVKAAAELVAADADEESVAIIRASSLDTLGPKMHMGFGRLLRNGWSLWDQCSPLKRDAVVSHKIAHPDDISGLIIAWAVAIIRGEPFDPEEHCQQYHTHWEAMGMTSLQAGHWQEPV